MLIYRQAAQHLSKFNAPQAHQTTSSVPNFQHVGQHKYGKTTYSQLHMT
jgi:hypothetical protein